MHWATEVCCTGAFCGARIRCFTAWTTTGKRADVISCRAAKIIKHRDRRNHVENEGRRERRREREDEQKYIFSSVTQCDDSLLNLRRNETTLPFIYHLYSARYRTCTLNTSCASCGHAFTQPSLKVRTIAQESTEYRRLSLYAGRVL